MKKGFKNTDEQLKTSNKLICQNIEEIKPDKIGFYSGNILNELRTFIEVVAVKISRESEYSHDVFNNIKSNVIGRYKFLSQFHQLLQKSSSHFSEIGENAQRLILKYYVYLLEIKKLLKEEYGLDVLENINDYPITFDSDLQEYYEKIAEKIKKPSPKTKLLDYSDSYYIEKIKPFPVGLEVYYEVTFKLATDYTSKFDRKIAFTKIKLLPNYAVKFTRVREDSISILGREISIVIINDYEVSIRPCEIKNFGRFFKNFGSINNKTNEYQNLVGFLKKYHVNLLDIISFDDVRFEKFKNYILRGAKSSKIIEILGLARDIIKQNKAGSNILRYILYVMNNNVIKKQYNIQNQQNNNLSNLNLHNKTIPFDSIPYSFSLPNHNPRFFDLINCISFEDRECELFARYIRNNSESNGQLYTDEKSIKSFEVVDNLIKEYNDKLWFGHKPEACLEKNRGDIYIHGYEKYVIKIIEKIIGLSKAGFKGHSKAVKAWLLNTKHIIDDETKKKFLINMFEDSKVSLIYGSAGTGKTTMIEHIVSFFSDKDSKQTLLANTHSAKNNLKKRIKSGNPRFSTVKGFLYGDDFETDILIIDECSTVSNEDMYNILDKASFKLLVLVGDIYQIESIRFGNWFSLLKDFCKDCSIELSETRRTKDSELLGFWNSVRNLEGDIEERISRNNYAKTLDNSIFNKTDKDEIILCLNYDGLYGINNINKLLQENNTNETIKWGVDIYKIGDPVLFNDIQREDWRNIIYNNLRGVIKNIKKEINKEGKETKIIFDIEIDDVLSEFDVANTGIVVPDGATENKSIIRFYVNKIESVDEDSNPIKDDVVPFQIAYAVSIHKAQGLEYDSVKIVITDEVEERISHNIFYTAITRAKSKLQIYWSPQTQNSILKKIKPKFDNKDYYLLKQKINSISK